MEQEPKEKPEDKPGPDPDLIWGDEAPMPIQPEPEEEKDENTKKSRKAGFGKSS